MNSLTEYQQGNRDGLLSLAAELDIKLIELDEKINTQYEHMDKWSLNKRKKNSELFYMMLGIREQTAYIASLARKRSEALPENPNNS